MTGEFRFFDAPIRARELINSGVLDRFPDLKVGFVEVDCGWVPYVKEQMDERFKRADPNTRPRIKLLPSQYYDRNLFFVYITDTYGIANRHLIASIKSCGPAIILIPGRTGPGPGRLSSVISRGFPIKRKAKSWRETPSESTASARTGNR